ncbi:MAG TPA: hypothetical protein VFI29_08170 [Hanamia sp.]|nr:hypothetical protein [Hanamia sp.]
MNSTEYIALIIIVALVTFVFVISGINRIKKKNKKRQLTAEFDHFAIKNNLAIDKKQTLNNNIIGIDRLNMKVIFLNNSDTKGEFHLIELNDLAACQLIKQKNSSTGHISKIFLKCIFLQKSRAPIELPFYDEMKDDIYKMMRLSKKALYWVKSINIFRESARLSMGKMPSVQN